MDKKQAHLAMILDIINRLANNSFLLKGWTVVLISGLLALASNQSDSLYFIYLSYLPATAFWILDGYYLWQERIYRKLYEHVLTLEEKDINFSMNTIPHVKQAQTWFSTVFSKTLLIFHGTIVVSIFIITMLVLNNTK